MAGARWNRGSMRCVVKRNGIRVHFSDRARCFGVRHFETTKLRNYETTKLRNYETTKLTPSQIKSYIRRGEFSKCYEVKDIKIAECTPETIQKVGEAFPQATLPQPVPENASLTCIFTFSDLLNAYRRLKVCKSPGLSGWTKELLFRVFHNPPMGVQQNLVDMFNCFVNAYISEEEKEFLRTAVLTPFEYIAKEGKIRNIVILDGITKICWNIIFWNLPEDPHVENSGSVFNKKGQCTLATHTIQGALNEGRVVIILDAKNAFPTLLRSAFFDYIQKHYRVYGIMVNFMNMMYAQPIHAKWFAHGRDPITYDITNGTIQGCISGPKLYTLGTIDVHHNCGKVLVQVADDVTVIAKSDPIGNALNVIQRFASVGQQLAGPKTKILLPSTVDEKDIKKMIRNTELQNATIITQPVLSLGCYQPSCSNCSTTQRSTAGQVLQLCKVHRKRARFEHLHADQILTLAAPSMALDLLRSDREHCRP